jgi:hypothetical protein
VLFFGYSGFRHNKTDHHDITEILLKVALITISQIKPKPSSMCKNENIAMEMDIYRE